MDFIIDESVLRIIEVVAAVASILTFLVGVFLKFFRQTEDVSLRNFGIASPLLLVCTWFGLRFPVGAHQVLAVKLVFILAGAVALFAIAMRWMEARAYEESRLRPLPTGFDHIPNKTPYFVLLGSLTVAMLLLILVYTAPQENSGNAPILLIWLTGLAIWLLFCRLLWQAVDTRILREWYSRENRPLPRDVRIQEEAKEKSRKDQ